MANETYTKERKVSVGISLSLSGNLMLSELADERGLARSHIVEMAVREFYRRETGKRLPERND